MTERPNEAQSSDANKGYSKPARQSEQAVQTFGDSYHRERKGTAGSDKNENEPERILYSAEEQF
jgi:hypothetical protein